MLICPRQLQYTVHRDLKGEEGRGEAPEVDKKTPNLALPQCARVRTKVAQKVRLPTGTPVGGAFVLSRWCRSLHFRELRDVHASVQLFLMTLRVLQKFMCTYAAHKEYALLSPVHELTTTYR